MDLGTVITGTVTADPLVVVAPSMRDPVVCPRKLILEPNNGLLREIGSYTDL